MDETGIAQGLEGVKDGHQDGGDFAAGEPRRRAESGIDQRRQGQRLPGEVYGIPFSQSVGKGHHVVKAGLVAVHVLDGDQVRRAQPRSRIPVVKQRLIFLLQQLRTDGRYPLERPVIAHRLGAAQLNLAKPAATEQPDQAVAVKDFGRRWMVMHD